MASLKKFTQKLTPYHAISKSFYISLATSTLIALPLIILQSALAKGRRVKYVPPSGLDTLRVSASGVARATRDTCAINNVCPIALLPNLKLEKAPVPQTISENPTIYFLVPKVDGNAYFRLYEDNGTSSQPNIYKTKFKIKNDAGLIAFRLPDDAPKLEVNKQYSWQLSLPVGQYTSQSVYGSLRRVALNNKAIANLATIYNPLDRAALFAAEGIWFEAVQTLAEAQIALPQNAEVLSEWRELLKSASLERVLPFSLVLQK